MSFEWLFAPVEHLDAWVAGLFEGAPLPVALGLALMLGLRHASDPDHLVAVTSLMASDAAGTRRAMRLGAWWGVGHAAILLALGLPLIAFRAELPPWLETGAERAVGVIILGLALRVIWKWARGDYEARAHSHGGRRHRHLLRGADGHAHDCGRVRSARQAFGIGILHGLAGTGAVVVLLIAALPHTGEAALALAVFAPMSIASMGALTGAFAWALTRPVVDPLYRRLLIPALGMFGAAFGLWYAGLS
jgi:ABC-type nickel/cobalt efflux system permease component RcnA